MPDSMPVQCLEEEAGLIESVKLETEPQAVLIDADKVIYRLRGYEHDLMDCLFPAEPGVNTLGLLFTRQFK